MNGINCQLIVYILVVVLLGLRTNRQLSRKGRLHLN